MNKPEELQFSVGIRDPDAPALPSHEDPQWPEPLDAGQQEWSYEAPCARGFVSVEVLPFLKGRKIDNVVKAYVHSLRPRCIRITRGGMHADAHPWRVTILLNKDDTIHEITQEVEVGLFGDQRNGRDVRSDLHGVKRWNPGDVVICNPTAIARVDFI